MLDQTLVLVMQLHSSRSMHVINQVQPACNELSINLAQRAATASRLTATNPCCLADLQSSTAVMAQC
jgi:hypothetical protein